MVKSSVSSRKTNIFRISKFKFWNSILAVLYTRAISVPHISEYMEKETNQHVFGSFKTELFPVDKLIVIQSFGINCRTLFDVMKRRFSVCVNTTLALIARVDCFVERSISLYLLELFIIKSRIRFVYAL